MLARPCRDDLDVVQQAAPGETPSRRLPKGRKKVRWPGTARPAQGYSIHEAVLVVRDAPDPRPRLWSRARLPTLDPGGAGPFRTEAAVSSGYVISKDGRLADCRPNSYSDRGSQRIASERFRSLGIAESPDPGMARPTPVQLQGAALARFTLVESADGPARIPTAQAEQTGGKQQSGARLGHGSDWPRRSRKRGKQPAVWRA